MQVMYKMPQLFMFLFLTMLAVNVDLKNLTYEKYVTFWKNHTCVFPPQSVYANQSELLAPCINDLSHPPCDTFLKVSTQLCMAIGKSTNFTVDDFKNIVNESKQLEEKLCSLTQRKDKNIQSFAKYMNSSEECEKICIGSGRKICAVLVAALCKYTNSSFCKALDSSGGDDDKNSKATNIQESIPTEVPQNTSKQPKTDSETEDAEDTSQTTILTIPNVTVKPIEGTMAVKQNKTTAKQTDKTPEKGGSTIDSQLPATTETHVEDNISEESKDKPDVTEGEQKNKITEADGPSEQEDKSHSEKGNKGINKSDAKKTDDETNDAAVLESGSSQDKKKVTNKVAYDDDDESYSSGHFLGYFLAAVVICVAGYIIFHNKQKIMAFVIEGRGAHQRRQRSKGVKYSELKSNVEEVMPSLEKTAMAKNFIY